MIVTCRLRYKLDLSLQAGKKALTVNLRFRSLRLARLTLDLHYPIDLSEARQRLEKERLRLTTYLGEQGGTGAATWEEDVLKFSARILGGTIEGNLTLADGTANLDANVPFPMLMFRGKLESRLRKILKIETAA